MSLNTPGQTQHVLFVKQINLHHAKGSTDLIDRAIQVAQTKQPKQQLIVLIQEPYIDVNSYKVKGFNTQYCNVQYLNKGMKTRTCIVATKNVSITILPQFCDETIHQYWLTLVLMGLMKNLSYVHHTCPVIPMNVDPVAWSIHL